jgi:mono/diheme cytochrome c family protein
MRRWLVCLFVASACGGQSIEAASCPPSGTPLTYANFGRAFFDAHCVHCHGGTDSHSSRAFLTVEAIRELRERIYANATGENPPMPPGPDDPPAEERAQLAEWLVCGAPP